MVEIVITSIICATILLGLLMFAVPDFFKSSADAQVTVMEQKQIADDRIHERWKEMLQLEAKLNEPPELAPSVEVQLAQIELAKLEAESKKIEAETAKEKADLELQQYRDHRHRGY